MCVEGGGMEDPEIESKAETLVEGEQVVQLLEEELVSGTQEVTKSPPIVTGNPPLQAASSTGPARPRSGNPKFSLSE